MKTLLSILALGVCFTTMAQEKETTTKETTTVKTTINTGAETKTATKEVTTTAKQVLSVSSKDAGQTNQAALKSAVMVKTDTDYSFGNENFKLKNDNKIITNEAVNNYIVIKEQDGKMVEVGKLMPGKKPGLYILKMGKTKTKGYFNAEGEFKVLAKSKISGKAKTESSSRKSKTILLDDDY